MSSGSNVLAGKVAIVTGAGQGIGEAIAVGYAAAGAKVILTGRTKSKLDDVVGKIEAAGGTAIGIEALAGNKEHAELTVNRAISEWGRVDALVNNAHTFTDYLPIEDPKMEENCMIDFQSAFFGSLQLMQLCFPHMVKQGGGSIINMGTGYSIRCEPGFLAYAASKEAIRALTKTAAREWGKHKIRVNVICPAALSPIAVKYLDEHPDEAEMYRKEISLGYFGDPEADIGPVALFLASDDSRYVTGQTINADGGQMML